MPVKALGNLAVTGQSLALVGHTFPSKKKKGKKKKPKFINSATGIIVGTSLIRASAAEVAKL